MGVKEAEVCRIKCGKLPRHLEADALHIFETAFGMKFHYALQEKEVRDVVYRLLIPDDTFLYVEEEGKLLGLLCYKLCDTKDGVTRRALQKELGKWKGFVTFLKLIVFYHEVKKDELYIDFLAVNPEARGKGIGTQLIQKAVDQAIKYAKPYVSLSVIDTNVGAKKLYEREGFKQVKTSTVSPVDKLYRWNFKKVYVMHKAIEANPQ